MRKTIRMIGDNGISIAKRELNSNTVKALETKGIVSVDIRVMRVYLTNQGLQVYQELS